MLAIVFLAKKKQRACIVMSYADVIVQLFRIYMLLCHSYFMIGSFLPIGIIIHLCAMAVFIHYAATQTNKRAHVRICIALGIGSILLSFISKVWNTPFKSNNMSRINLPLSQSLFFFMLAAGFRLFIPVTLEKQRRVTREDWFLFLAFFSGYVFFEFLGGGPLRRYDVEDFLKYSFSFYSKLNQSFILILPYLVILVYCLAIVFLAQKKQRTCIIMCSVGVLVQLFLIYAFSRSIYAFSRNIDEFSRWGLPLHIFSLIGILIQLCAMAVLIHYAATQTNKRAHARICIALGIGSVLLSFISSIIQSYNSIIGFSVRNWPLSQSLFFFMLAAGFCLFVPVKREKKAPQTPEDDYLTQYKRQNRI